MHPFLSIVLIRGLLLSCAMAAPVAALGDDRAAAPIKTREAEQLIEEYAASGTSAQRKSELLVLLRTATEKTLATVVKRTIREESTRDATIGLIADLPVPGMFKQLEKCVSGDIEATAIRAIIVSGGKGANEFLTERWREAPLEGDAFRIIDAAFRTRELEPKVVLELRSLQKNEKIDPARRERITAILAFQLELTDEEVATLDERWSELIARFEAMNLRFRTTGEDHLARGDWAIGFGSGESDEDDEGEGEKSLVRRYRGKYLLASRGVLRLPGISWKSGSVRLRIMVIEGEGATVGTLMKNNAMIGPRYQENTWLLTESVRQTTAPGSPLQWAELVFTLSGSNVSVAMDGRQLGATSDFGDQINGLFFTAGSGRLLVGSAERLP